MDQNSDVFNQLLQKFNMSQLQQLAQRGHDVKKYIKRQTKKEVKEQDINPPKKAVKGKKK